MAVQAIAGMVAMAASIWIGSLTYAKEKPTSIGINADQLVLIATKFAGWLIGAISLLAALKASQPALTSQTQLERLALI